jgi:Rrf2 family cysteine metabolism transcriptional repressor
MHISTRGRYALRAILDLALHADEGPVLRQDIAVRQGISAEYIAQLFRRLAAVGLVKGVKGPGGGYILGRDAATIRVGDVLRAVEGPIAAVHCALPDDPTPCYRLGACVTRLLWVQLSEAVAEFLDSVTLRDLCEHVLAPSVSNALPGRRVNRAPFAVHRLAIAAVHSQPMRTGAYTYEI